MNIGEQMSKQNTTKLLLDLGAFIALLISSAPHFTGDTIHEWLGVALSGAIVVHLLLNWNWVVAITSRLFSKMAKGQRFNYFLNWALFASGIMIVLSGLMISKTVVPFFGLTLPQNMSWKELHELSTNIVMLLMGLHVAVHWSWIVNMFKNLLVRRPAEKTTATPVLSMQRKDA
jgi:cytochrome b561